MKCAEIKFIDYLDDEDRLTNIVPLIIVKPLPSEEPILKKVKGTQCLYIPERISSSVCVPRKIESEK